MDSESTDNDTIALIEQSIIDTLRDAGGSLPPEEISSQLQTKGYSRYQIARAMRRLIDRKDISLGKRMMFVASCTQAPYPYIMSSLDD